MAEPTTPNFRAVIEQFLMERLEGKLDKLANDDPKRAELRERFRFETWISDAAARAHHVKLATHVAKATHPSSKGSNIYLPSELTIARQLVGTHSLTTPFDSDAAVSDAKHLDVYAFLQRVVFGRPLLDFFLESSSALKDALSSNPDRAAELMRAFASVAIATNNPPSADRLKQIYWLNNHDARVDDDYQLLAPLYASSLAHAVFHTINTDRFSEASKDARQARRNSEENEMGFREYPHLAVQILGGSNNQNVSRMNGQRKGNNYLLASLPPNWTSRTIRRPWRTDSIFARFFGKRPEVRKQVDALREFLLSNPPANVHTRNRVENSLDGLIGELVMVAAELQAGLAAGWSTEPECELVEAERLWLDPGRAEFDEEFHRKWQWMGWPDEIGKRFGNWLNSTLGSDLPLGDAEQRQWRRELLGDEDEFGWAWHLNDQRKYADREIDHASQGVQP